MAAAVIISILSTPLLRKIFQKEEQEEEKDKHITIKRFIQDNKNGFLTYIGLFLGVYISFYTITFIAGYFGWGLDLLFQDQGHITSLLGQATGSTSLFWSILENNYWVLLACFLLSLLSGNGAIFFIVWNAIIWAMTFATRSILAANILALPVAKVSILMQLIVLPHMLIEGIGYILAGIAGAIISKDIERKKENMRTFIPFLVGVLAIFITVNATITLFTANPITEILLRIIITTGLIYLFKQTIQNKQEKKVFTYNFLLFIIAILVFIIGAIIETQVLTNSYTLHVFYNAVANLI